MSRNIIDDFIEETPRWLECIHEDFRDRPCTFCGMIPNNMLLLVDAIKELREKAWMYDELGH